MPSLAANGEKGPALKRILRPLTTTAVLALLTFGLAAPAQAAPSDPGVPTAPSATLHAVLKQLGELLDQTLDGLSGTVTG